MTIAISQHSPGGPQWPFRLSREIGQLTLIRASFTSIAVNEETPLMSNFLDDVLLFSESEAAQSLFVAAAEIRRSLHRAASIAVSNGLPLRSLWQIEDLLSPSAFKSIVNDVRERRNGSGLSEVTVLLLCAERWVAIDSEKLESLIA